MTNQSSTSILVILQSPVIGLFHFIPKLYTPPVEDLGNSRGRSALKSHGKFQEGEEDGTVAQNLVNYRGARPVNFWLNSKG